MSETREKYVLAPAAPIELHLQGSDFEYNRFESHDNCNTIYTLTLILTPASVCHHWQLTGLNLLIAKSRPRRKVQLNFLIIVKVFYLSKISIELSHFCIRATHTVATMAFKILVT